VKFTSLSQCLAASIAINVKFEWTGSDWWILSLDGIEIVAQVIARHTLG
jgi:hypothetical protein